MQKVNLCSRLCSRPGLEQLKQPITNTNILILLQSAEKLGIKYQVLDWEKHKIKLTKNNKSHIITSKSLGINSSQAIAFTKDKSKVVHALKKACLPVLPQIVIKNLKDYQSKIPFPQVIKPLFGQKGKHVYLNIKTQKQAEKLIKKLLKEVGPCLIEPYFKAKDYRFMLLNNQVIGLSQRKPPVITADGKHNLKQLIEIENQKRFDYNKKVGQRMLNRMLIWSRIKWYINQQGLKFTDIPSKNKEITVYPIPNFSTGGTVQTIPFTQHHFVNKNGAGLNKIHPDYLNLAVKTSKLIGLTIIGIDMLIKDIRKPSSEKNCTIIEVNSDPGLRLHHWPNVGETQKVTEKILKYIFTCHSGAKR